MTYFKYLSIILGSLMMLSCLWTLFRPKSYEWMALRLLPEKQPWWILVVGLAVLGWVGWTWVEFAAFRSPLTLIVSIIVSLTIFKVILLFFMYAQYRNMVIALLTTDRPALTVILVSYLVLGAGLIAIGLVL